MRTLIYGGSFNPPHKGHVSAVKAALEQKRIDRVLVIPSGTPPHKILAEGSPNAAERLELCRLAFGDIKGAEICDIEIHEEDVDYTADTIRSLQKLYPGDEFALLVGSDMFLTLDTWYQSEFLLRGRDVYGMARNEDETPLLEQKAKQLEAEYGCRGRLLPKKLVVLSSTEVRGALKERRGRELLPEKVYAEIIAHRFYGAKPDLAWLREKGDELLKPKRIPHVRGCEETAAALAQHWGEDEGEAAEAAILHDCTKKLKDEDQLKLFEHFGICPDAEELASPQLFHAETGACLARERFGVSDRVYNAIRWHTTGRPGMSTLEKILYLADAMEPNRSYEGVEELRKLSFEDLDAAMKLGLRMSCDTVRARGQSVYHVTEEALRFFTELKEQ